MEYKGLYYDFLEPINENTKEIRDNFGKQKRCIMK